MECWGLQARSTELLHFISSCPLDLISIQESNLNLSSSFQIPGFFALRSDRTHYQSGIFSSDVTDASGNIIILIRQGLFFSELFTFPLSSLDPYSDYVEVNISLNDSSLLSFLNVYSPPYLLFSKGKQNQFLFYFYPSLLRGSRSTRIFALPLPQKKDHFQLLLLHPWFL